MTTGIFHNGVPFKIMSCASIIMKAFMRKGRHALVHDFSSLAFTLRCQQLTAGVLKGEFID